MADINSPDPLDEFRNRVGAKLQPLPSKEALLKQADGLRDLARRAKRLGDTATDDEQRRLLERCGEEFQESASRLERSAIKAKSR